jgi:LytR cell envelope-related transcriptional attenuator
MEVNEVIDVVGGVVAAIATLGILLLIPLYLSQRRDLKRLHEWMDADPGHPGVDMARSEAMLDRAEAELEESLGEPSPGAAAPVAPPTPTGEVAPTPAGGTTPVPAAQRVTSERPALERITMERAALEPHPRWRSFVARINQPKLLIGIAIAAVVLGAGAIFVTEKLLESDDEEAPARAGAVDPAEISVTVLNGVASIPGLAARVGDDVEAAGFELQRPLSTTSGTPYDQTVVMFSRGHQREANAVARDLGVPAVQPLDQRTEGLSGGADVLVIAGEDRAQP